MAATKIVSRITSVWKVLAKPVDVLQADATLMALESMKRETPLMVPDGSRRALLAALGLSPFSAMAQASRPTMRIISTGVPGSVVDAVARAVQPNMGKALGQEIFVDNVVGGGTVLGTRAIAKAPPDGNTVGIIASNFAILPSVYKNLQYDSVADITPIAIIGSVPLVLVVGSELPVRDAQELATLLRTGNRNFGTPGDGTLQHLIAKAFVDAAKAQALHIPYKGTVAQLTDVAAGRVDFGVAAFAAAAGLVAAGKLRVLGTVGVERMSAAPGIPTIREQGFPDVDFDAWIAMIAPGKLSATEVRRIHAALVQAVNMPSTANSLAGQQIAGKLSTPEFAAEFLSRELARFGKLAAAASIERQ